MTKHTKLAIRALTSQLRLKVKYTGTLPGKVPGFLIFNGGSGTIVINATKSASDHAFTILHEIAHYILHCICSHQMRLPWYLTRQWKSNLMTRWSKTTKRAVSRKFNAEWQADMWAFCALLHIGATDDFQAILAHYPEKSGRACLCVAGSLYAGIKSRLKKTFVQILHPFTAFLLRL